MEVPASRYCIITPDAVGPVTNGGIGTHCTNLARLLATIPESDVTLLFTGPVERENADFWRDYYRSNYRVTFVDAETLDRPFDAPVQAATSALERSETIHVWLKTQNFDTLFFQDWQANGFVTLQAKRAGLAYQNTLITCTLHSPTEWQRQGMEKFPSSRSDLVLEFMERYVLQHADAVISPSRHMYEWAEVNHWKIAADHRVLPYPFFLPERAPTPRDFDRRTLIFFGRLETRKGLEIFLDALVEIAPALRVDGKRLHIHFVGKIAETNRGKSTNVIEETLRPSDSVFDWELHTEFSQSEAVRFLVDHREGLVVTPSLLDNLPFAIIECLELRLHIIAAATGGIPELFESQTPLFKAGKRALAAKLRQVLAEGIDPTLPAYSSITASEGWFEFARSAATESSPTKTTAPRISVCIPHFNYGRFLPGLLESLCAQTYANFEVVAVDDGSTDSESRKVFSELREKHAGRGWKFFERENEGVGNARNFAVSQAEGEYLIFMDPDNIAKPDMIKVFATAIQHSKADCLTCYLCAFKTEEDLAAGRAHYTLLPAGACLEEGFSSNIFGDANLIIRKDVFQALGGFREVAGVTVEDWEFLSRLCLEGYELDVIPEYLFHYRYHETSRTGDTHRYRNTKYVLEAYAEKLPDWANRYIFASLGIAERINDPAVRDRIEDLKAKIEKLKREKNTYKDRTADLERRRKLKYRIRRLFGRKNDK